MNAVKVGQYQARLDDQHILGYFDTKKDAVKLAWGEAMMNALKGYNTGTDWYVGEVIWVGSRTESSQHQMSDGSGRFEWGVDQYDVVVTSTVALGKATHKYHRTTAPTGIAQGQAR